LTATCYNRRTPPGFIMPIQNLHQFIAALEARQQLARINVPIARELEITEITDRISKLAGAANKALVFEHVKGFSMPLAINLFGSAERMALALGVDDLDELGQRLGTLLDLRLPQGLGAALNRGQELLGALRSVGLGPSKVRHGPVQQIVETQTPSLDELPILKCWPGDGGYFITLPQVITRDPQSQIRNVGMYRLQAIDDQRLLVHWQRHKGGSEHERVARAAGVGAIPAAIVLGGDPAAMWCASAPLPPDVDEYLLAGWIRGKPIEFVDCVSQPLEVPAEAEIVLEGTIRPDEHLPEGPFGDHTGYYTPLEGFPVFHLTAVTRRAEPIYPTTIVGIPPMEDVWMGKATERIFLPLLRLFMPEIIDINMPAEGIFHNLVLVSIHKRFPGHARKVIHGLWGMGLMMLAKAIVVFDEWVNVQNLSQAAWQALGNVDWARDIVLDRGPVDQLDHAASQPSFGGKIGIDATAKLSEEGASRPWPKRIEMDPRVKLRIDDLWEQLGLGPAAES
jgi:4-hydroxy-3-polyprenylbenzoate decarboxylase